jgi:hypothetical protein
MAQMNHESQRQAMILGWKAMAIRYHLIFDPLSGATASVHR